MAERVARKACLFAPLASRYIAKKIEAIEPKRVPTAPEKKLASGRSTAGGTGGALPAARGAIRRGEIAKRMTKAPSTRARSTNTEELKKNRTAARTRAHTGQSHEK